MESLEEVEPELIECDRDIINNHEESSILEHGKYLNYWQLSLYLCRDFPLLNLKQLTQLLEFLQSEVLLLSGYLAQNFLFHITFCGCLKSSEHQELLYLGSAVDTVAWLCMRSRQQAHTSNACLLIRYL